MELAEETAKNGNLPFAALLINSDGKIILEAVNTVKSTNNAAAHAEINLLFEASKVLQKADLSRYALVSNAASCAMCVTACIKANIKMFYYGAPNGKSMVPSITMSDILKSLPYPVEVHKNILAEECSKQITELTMEVK